VCMLSLDIFPSRTSSGYFRTFKVIFFGAGEPPGLIGPSVFQSLVADNGGLVANGDGTDGMLNELLRKADPGPAKKGPPPTLEEAGGDMAPAGGLEAGGAGGDAAEIGPPSVLNSAHLGHLRFVFM